MRTVPSCSSWTSLKNPVLIDFRSADKFKEGHVENAVNIPYDELWTFDNLEKLNKSKELVIIHDDPVVAGGLAVSFRLLEDRTYLLISKAISFKK